MVFLVTLINMAIPANMGGVFAVACKYYTVGAFGNPYDTAIACTCGTVCVLVGCVFLSVWL
jgi:hypothetical protein